MDYAHEDSQLKEMFDAVKKDKMYQSVVEKLRSGMMKDEVVVQEEWRPGGLKSLHLPHDGVHKTREIANERYY